MGIEYLYINSQPANGNCYIGICIADINTTSLVKISHWQMVAHPAGPHQNGYKTSLLTRLLQMLNGQSAFYLINHH